MSTLNLYKLNFKTSPKLTKSMTLHITLQHLLADFIVNVAYCFASERRRKKVVSIGAARTYEEFLCYTDRGIYLI